jgi:biopolymer transport protein ExbD
MADKRQFIDVWIIETNTVYREVPYNVVCDWVQQGRLLEDDRVRPSGTREWLRLGGVAGFAAFLPRPEPLRADDQAEALEPVQTEFSWKRRSEEEEGDVDLIPLIDVSLVLLVFFLMTTSGIVASAFTQTPAAVHGYLTTDKPDLIWIGIHRAADGKPVYELGRGNQRSTDERDRDLNTQEEVLARLEAYLAETPRPVELTINAHKDLPAGIVRQLAVALERRPFRGQIVNKYVGVSEPSQ